MLKVTVDGMRMRVTARYRVDGSVMQALQHPVPVTTRTVLNGAALGG